jgi:hypothetical protein
VLVCLLFVVTVALLGTLGVEGAFMPPSAAPIAQPGDQEWTNMGSLVQLASADYISATKALSQVDQKDEPTRLHDYCNASEGLPNPASDKARSNASWVEDVCNSYGFR